MNLVTNVTLLHCHMLDTVCNAKRSIRYRVLCCKVVLNSEYLAEHVYGKK